VIPEMHTLEVRVKDKMYWFNDNERVLEERLELRSSDEDAYITPTLPPGVYTPKNSTKDGPI
jgi:hypothetical protein